MIDVGLLLATQMDKFVSQKIPTFKKDTLTKVLTEGMTHTGRMLHYYPFSEKGKEEDDWFQWHNDYSTLTALTSAMYLDEEGN